MFPCCSVLRTGVRLEGNSDEQPGIEQCRLLVQEMTLLKTRPNAQDPQAAGHALAASTEDGGGVADSGTAADELVTVSSLAVGGALEESDPAMETAVSKSDLAMGKLSYYVDIEQLVNAVPSQIMTTTKAFILVDAPASKVKVVNRLIEHAAAVANILPAKNKIKIAVSAGSRVDLLAAVNSKMASAFPHLQVYCVQLSHGDR